MGGTVPELPEVQAIAEGLDRACRGRTVAHARALQPATVKTAAPGLDDLVGRRLDRVWRRGKLVGLTFGDLDVVIHLMQSGRLGLVPAPAGRPPRTTMVVIGLDDGRELRLREAATEHRASLHVIPTAGREAHPAIAALGPEPIGLPPEVWRERLSAPPGRLHNALREGRRIAGIGRAYAGDIMWAAKLAPFARTDRLTDEEWTRLARAADVVLGQALERARAAIATDMPTRESRVTAVHGHHGEPCLRCGRRLERVAFAGYELVYCPDCQTGGRVYADRRFSRFVK